MINKILMIGYGYTAQYFSSILLKHDISVRATTRDGDKIKQWAGSPIKLILLKPNEYPINITGYNYILISAPPNTDGSDPIIESLKNQLIEHKNEIQWIGYLSSTSVYGDHKGKWVDEKSMPITPGERGIRRLKAENIWMSLFENHSLPVHIFRLAGIYGPNRNSLVRIINGKNTTIVKEGQIFSRIHIEDICRALFESLKQPTPGEVYNLADDLPSAPELVDDYAAQLLKKPDLIKLPFEKTKLSPTAKEFYQHCRKVSNVKLKKKFNFNLHYPSYKDGLKKLHRDL
ncbi:MAG: SDR family oxidoreductase [Gammaproteobacteria bacterium]|nr:SDR family oxidoreductase [Gammaproteobacteria bacterium]